MERGRQNLIRSHRSRGLRYQVQVWVDSRRRQKVPRPVLPKLCRRAGPRRRRRQFPCLLSPRLPITGSQSRGPEGSAICQNRPGYTTTWTPAGPRPRPRPSESWSRTGYAGASISIEHIPDHTMYVHDMGPGPQQVMEGRGPRAWLRNGPQIERQVVPEGGKAVLFASGRHCGFRLGRVKSKNP